MFILKIALTLSLTLTAAGVIIAPPATAGPSDTRSYNVRYNPAELASPDRAEDILRRVHLTATYLCADEIGPKRFTEKLHVQRCLREVTQDLVNKIDHRNLDIAHTNYPAPRKLVKRDNKPQWAKLGYSAP